MAHPLQQRVRRVRRLARWLLAVYAVCWIATSVTLAVLVLATADYWIRFRDPGIRLMSSLAVVAVACWAVNRFGWCLFGRSLAEVQVARRIERFFPALTDRLASTIQFLGQAELDPQAGSAALRRAVILETESAAEDLDFAQACEPRPARRALGVALLTAAAAAVIALAAPDNTRIALARLARPLGDDAWPRVYNLAFKDAPTQLAAGQTFEVELVQDAAHRVPDEVQIYYRYETGSTVETETETMQLLNGVVVARKQQVNRPFSYRAEGGDDQSMDWIPLEVVEPPRIESLGVTLHPPEYTGLPVEPGEKSIHALRGTRVAFAGKATKPLSRATIHQEHGDPIEAVLTPDGYGFALAADADAPFVVEKTGTWWITLEDKQGLIGGADDRFDLRAVADRAPTLTIEQPSANIFVTPQGTVPLKIVAKDDLAIRRIALHFSRSDNSEVEDFAVPLYEGPQHVEPLQGTGLLATGRLAESRAVDHAWSLADLNLASQTQITFWATAGDYLPQSGKSTVRRLTIISPDELEDRLAQRQLLIFRELQRVLKLQQDARAQTKSLEIQVDQVGHMKKQDVDHAQAAELNQRQITRTLTSDSEGIPGQIRDFLADLQNNRVDSPDMRRHAETIADNLRNLGQHELPTIQRELTSMIKAAQAGLPRGDDEAKPPSPADPRIAKSLATAGGSQDQVIESLEGMIDDLRKWDNYRRFARDVSQLKHAQEDLANATRETARKTLGTDAKDLDTQQQADLNKLAHEQSQLSRQLEKTQQQMARMSKSLESSDPLAAAAIADGLHHAQRQATSGRMRNASQRLADNQLAQAASEQTQIAKDLDEMLAILSNRKEQELARLVEQLRNAEKRMAELRARQRGLQKQMQQAAAQPESDEKKLQLQRLARQQKEVQEEAARLARRLERLQAQQAGRSTASAAGKMDQAGGASQQGDAQAAVEQAQAAEKDLEEAQQRLAERRKQAEQDLAREQLAKLEDSLKSLHNRQEELTHETERLEQLRVANGKLTRGQSSTVFDLARQQKLLQTETSLLAEKLSLAEVINMALDGAARHMARAFGLLERQRTGGETQTAQEAARRRFAQLLAALQNKPKPGEGKQGEGGGGGGGSGGRPDGAQVLTQLKLLKILQEDLGSRYRALRESGPPSDSTSRELTDLAVEQGRLAELALELAKPPEDNPEDDPDSLPDVRQDGLDAELVPDLPELLEETEKEPN